MIIFLLLFNIFASDFLSFDEVITKNTTDVYEIKVEPNKLTFVNLDEKLMIRIYNKDSLVISNLSYCIFFANDSLYKIKIDNTNNKDIIYQMIVQ